MADKLRTDELKKGHTIKLKNPLPNQPDSHYGLVKEVVHVADGPQVAIYRIDFERSAFSLMANADREFEVPSTQPGPVPHLLG